VSEQENREWLDDKLAHWERHGFGLYAWFGRDASVPGLEVPQAERPRTGMSRAQGRDDRGDPADGSAVPAGARLVGRAGLQRVDPDIGELLSDPDTIELMYALSFAAWGAGYASEIGRELLRVARDDLGAVEIVADTVPHNVRSRSVMERLGFAYERDIWHDDHPMVLYRKRLVEAG
jgi:RimJ/RimL family protein N-acetyltransferase